MNGRPVDIYLVTEAKTVDAFGDWTITETRRRVYAEERSVSQTEFYQGFAVGFKPEIKFALTNFMDYQGEKVVEYVPFMGNPDAPVRLNILRTFNAGDALELVCYKGVQKNANAEVTSEDPGEAGAD